MISSRRASSSASVSSSVPPVIRPTVTVLSNPSGVVVSVADVTEVVLPAVPDSDDMAFTDAFPSGPIVISSVVVHETLSRLNTRPAAAKAPGSPVNVAGPEALFAAFYLNHVSGHADREIQNQLYPGISDGLSIPDADKALRQRWPHLTPGHTSRCLAPACHLTTAGDFDIPQNVGANLRGIFGNEWHQLTLTGNFGSAAFRSRT